MGTAQIFFGIFTIREWYKLRKVKPIEIPLSNSNIMAVPELIIKRGDTWFTEYWLFKPNGEYLGAIRPHIPWYISFKVQKNF